MKEEIGGDKEGSVECFTDENGDGLSKQLTAETGNNSQMEMDSVTIEHVEENEQDDVPEQREAAPIPSHLSNTAHPKYIRYGIPLYLMCTFCLLLASDIGSGVSADIRVTVDGEIISHDTILTVSIFSSVGELWKTRSYPLAILIIITSICWPYFKLGLSMFAWVAPPAGGGVSAPRRRERLIEWLDKLDKWSFVDIFVLTIMMVAFRSTIPVGAESLGIDNDVFLVPKWGFFGFVFASILSQLSTHVILHLHRRVIYPELLVGTNEHNNVDMNAENGSATNEEAIEAKERDVKAPLFQKIGHSPVLTAMMLVTTFCLLLVGCLVTSFTFTYERGLRPDTSDPDYLDKMKLYVYEERDFTVANIGLYITDSAIDPNDFGIRFLQAFYFLLAIVTPLENIVIFSLLYFVPMKDKLQRKIFYLSEITFAWGASEVMMLSSIFSVNQIPDFGTGIVDSGCDTCFVVGAKLQNPFW
eukprot:CAMPEP_0185728078 /NCGR_PEP_ID=MMETSP1171-20130828/3555_1 /TAXON_ID=374046 /ORGANISM="Helicotheca tamensis, Strain CCMP826" /LENGTH=471 /DNA_ID=CAMNT_0028396745 /DNA_START=88 /DNA_END=1500 /DNA_ORIENTATION=+